MRQAFLFLLGLAFTTQLFSQQLTLKNLRCEYKNNPLGIESTSPSLSWELSSDKQKVLQQSYRIIVADNRASINKNIGNLWDSKKVSSNASIQIPYKGNALHSAKTYYWKVMVWNNKGKSSSWSEVASWQMGLLSIADWNGAKWIAYEKLPDSSIVIPAEHSNGTKRWANQRNVLPLLRKSFPINKPVAKATAFISGLGQFEMSINGTKTGDHFLDPGWTKYDERSLYVTFDITNQLIQGNNALGVMLGNGFYYSTRERYRKLTGAFGYPKMICNVLVEYQDGSTETIISDETWKTSSGPITFSSIYGGEDYDARLEQKDWNTPSFNTTTWKVPVIVDGPRRLESQMAEPVKIFEEFNALKVTELGKSKWVYDMGQNASGIPSIIVSGKRGDSIRITPGELVNEDGTVTQKHTGSPSYYIYILKGEGKESWQPRFTYYGYRYIQVELLNAAGTPATIVHEVRSKHIRNAAENTGTFTSSNELFNKTYTLIDWAIRSNTVSIFTDCPHRERLGWLEQVYLVGSSIRYGYGVNNLFIKMLEDMRVSQTKEGLITSTSPEYTEMHFADGYFRDSPEWGSAGIIVPWYMYQWYGDKNVLARYYDMMQRYINYLGTKATNNILTYGLSDWYDIGPERSGFSQLTPLGLTATATYYYDLSILQQIANLLGKQEDATRYEKLANDVKTAFNEKFFDKQKMQYGAGSQTSNAMAVYMKLVAPENKAAVVKSIVNDIRNRNNSLTSGDIGYRYLLRVLDDEGLSDLIYDMNSRYDVPGYGYQLNQGATALTESWVASRQVSNNHFMLGHIWEWFYSGLGGIRQAPNSIAYKEIEIRPEPVGDVTFAKATYHCPYGEIISEWKIDKGMFVLDVNIPVNTTAIVYLPAKQSSVITLNGKVVSTTMHNIQKAIIKIGSGRYTAQVLYR